ncbi:DUF4126 family protein [Lichenicoccus sp.]|uniref:DUF4126 family protein n=1 Tax=Lichenicoccus sp. TaxID=2781899 RepID=UPI003D1162B2
MLASLLMGLLGGQRAMMPLAAVSVATAYGRLPARDGALRFIGHPLVAAGAAILAVGEMAGDKQKGAPNRIIPIGLVARFMTSAIAGASLARRRQRWLGAAAGGSIAVAASYAGWRARMACIPRYGRISTGLVEDTFVVLGAVGILWMVGRSAGEEVERPIDAEREPARR